MARILVADDDTVMLGLLQTLLQLEGHETVTVTRPENIVTAVEVSPPALILMDYHLAGGNALEALQQLKGSEKMRGIPVLVTSGMDRELECLRAGADGFILKPFRPTELMQRIQSLLSSS